MVPVERRVAAWGFWLSLGLTAYFLVDNIVDTMQLQAMHPEFNDETLHFNQLEQLVQQGYASTADIELYQSMQGSPLGFLVSGLAGLGLGGFWLYSKYTKPRRRSSFR